MKMNEYSIENSKDKLMHFSRPMLPIKFYNSISKIQKNKKKIPLEERRKSVRDKLLVELHKQFSLLVQKKVYKVTDFYKFIEDKANNSIK